MRNLSVRLVYGRRSVGIAPNTLIYPHYTFYFKFTITTFN